MAPKIGWHGRNHEIKVSRTGSGNGFRIRDRAKKHDAYAYPNSGNIVVRFDGDHVVWRRPSASAPAHQLSPHSLHRAVFYLVSMMWQAIAEDKRAEDAHRRWEKNKPVCRSCGKPEPIPGYVDRQTGQCQWCDDRAIDLADERGETKEAARADPALHLPFAGKGTPWANVPYGLCGR